MIDEKYEISMTVLETMEHALKQQLKAIRKIRQELKCTHSDAAKKKVPQIKMVYEVLREANCPLHISEIIKLVKQKYNENINRESIVSALVKKIKYNKDIEKVRPNTYELKVRE